MNKVTLKAEVSVPFLSRVLASNGIELYDVGPQENACVFTVKEKDFSACQKLLSSRGKEVEVVRDKTNKKLKETIFFRLGWVVGLVVFLVLSYLYSSTVLRLRVDGNELVSTQEIVEAVAEETTFPALKRGVDVKKIRTAVSLLPGVSNASVRVEGTTLFITVLEELAPVPIGSGEVTSLYDALITKVILYEGEEVVKVGDTVKKGDVLLKKNEKGVARGEIYGRIWLNEHIVVPAERLVSRRTGRTEVTYSFIGAKEKYRGKFSLYEAVREEVWVPMVVPIKLCKTTYYEVEQKRETVDFEKEKEEIVSAAFDRMERQLSEDAEKAEKWFFIKTVDKMTVLDLYYEAEVKINR